MARCCRTRLYVAADENYEYGFLLICLAAGYLFQF